MALIELQIHFLEQLDQLPENQKFSLRFPVQVETLARIKMAEASQSNALNLLKNYDASRTVASNSPSPSQTTDLETRRTQIQTRLQSVQARLEKKYSPSWIASAFEPMQDLFAPVMMVGATFFTDKANH